MYYTVYKITNKINNKEYIGAHKTSDLNDDYMGSGKHLKRSKEKYGLENFSKEIIFRAVSSEVMYFIERMLVDEEYVARDDTYNLKLGGSGGFDYINKRFDDGVVERNISKNTIAVRDATGKAIFIKSDDERFTSKELKGVTYGKTAAKDKHGNMYQVSVDDERLKTGELTGNNKFTTTVKDSNGNTLNVSVDDERLKTGELVGVMKGRVNVKDEFGNIYNISKNDERYLSGEFISVAKNKIQVYDVNGKMFKVEKDDIRLKTGELSKNFRNKITFFWITNLSSGENKQIKPNQSIPCGWVRGRKL